MTTYRFEKFRDPKNLYDTTTATMTVDTVVLFDVIEAFEDFLRASGFKFDGHLDLVDDADAEAKEG